MEFGSTYSATKTLLFWCLAACKNTEKDNKHVESKVLLWLR